MCHATSAGRKVGSVSTNKSQFVDTLSTNKAYHTSLVQVIFFSSMVWSKTTGISKCQVGWQTELNIILFI